MITIAVNPFSVDIIVKICGIPTGNSKRVLPFENILIGTIHE